MSYCGHWCSGCWRHDVPDLGVHVVQRCVFGLEGEVVDLGNALMDVDASSRSQSLTITPGSPPRRDASRHDSSREGDRAERKTRNSAGNHQHAVVPVGVLRLFYSVDHISKNVLFALKIRLCSSW